MNDYSKGIYLFKSYFGGRIDEIEILYISETSYYIKWESGSRSWRTKKEFHDEYILVEKLKVFSK